MTGSAFEGFFKSLLNRLGRKLIKETFEKSSKDSGEGPKKDSKKQSVELGEKSHPWRLCPVGQHWTGSHERGFPNNPSKKGPVQSYCAGNPSRKNSIVSDYLSRKEIHLISEQHFSSLTGPPTAGRLSEPDADKYDHLIRGWTKYWNEVLKPHELLDPDLVKALIASESTFNLKPKDQKTKSAGVARGYIQLTDEAIHALNDSDGELRNHLVQFSAEDAYDANMSICGGIRWLFRKKRLASGKLGREATWLEAIAEYKSYLNDINSGKDESPKGMRVIQSFYKKLKSEK